MTSRRSSRKSRLYREQSGRRCSTSARRSLMEGLLGRPPSQLQGSFSTALDHPSLFGRALSETKESELRKLIKSIESSINNICDINPNPVEVVTTSLAIRRKISQILKIAKPLAIKKEKQDKIKKQIKDLSESKDFKWSSKKKQFIRKPIKKKEKKEKKK